MPDRWLPLDIRDGGDVAGYDGPFPGVPPWLFAPLWDWAKGRLPPISDQYGYSLDAIRFYREMASTLRVHFESPIDPNGWHLDESLHAFVLANHTFLLTLVDYLLSMTPTTAVGASQAQQLNKILRMAGSIYEVRGDKDEGRFLSRRVSPEEAKVVDEVISAGGKPGRHMARAWRAAFGQKPNPGESYGEVVKAIEAATIPIVSPKNDKATLGTVIRDLRASPKTWIVRLRGPSDDDQVVAVADALDLIWKGHLRHGDPSPQAPIVATQEEAQAVIHLGLSLVKWFADGVIARR